MDAPICQSCGMPMTATEHFGTNKDLTSNKEYCCYCYNEGEFTDELDMDEMITCCADIMEEMHRQAEREFDKEQAIVQMKQYFPMLKRWRK